MTMLDFDTAQQRLAASVKATSSTQVLPLDKLDGQVLAEDIKAVLNLPVADNSSMDGYAVRYADLRPGVCLPVQQRCYAGQVPEPLLPRHAIRLFTGSLIPAGADTVFMQEDCTESEQGVSFKCAGSLGSHIRFMGEDMRAGELILARGNKLHAGRIAMLAAHGIAQAKVYKGIKIGILSTGDELYAPGQSLPSAGVYNSNTPMLASLARGLGVASIITRHVVDDLNKISSALQALSASCDLVLSVGGASVGEKDLIKPAIESLGGMLDLWRVRMKPGKPVALAHIGATPLVCLPGNPVSAFVVFTLLVSPMLRTMQGRNTIFMPVQRGLLDQPAGIKAGGRDDFLRVYAQAQDTGLPTLKPHSQQSSGALSSLGWANGLARIPAGCDVANGADIGWYSFAEWLD